MHRLYVTGGSGFVGSRLVSAATARGLDVADPATDVRDRDAVEREIAARRTDVVVHGAAVTHGAPRELVETNVGGTGNVAHACVLAGVRRLVLLSSGAVYGAVDEPERLVPESAALRGTNLYAVTKIAAERVCQEILRGTATELVVVRIGTLYGESERPTRLRPRTSPLHRLAALARERDRLSVHGLDVRRSYCHVDDASEALTTLASTSAAVSGTFHVDGAERWSLAELLAIVGEVRPELAVVPAKAPSLADFVMTPADERPALDVRRLARHVSWSRRPIATGLTSLLRVAPEHRGG